MSQNIKIHECDKFPFDDLKLSNPIAQSGGTYLIRFSHNDQPIYIQPPKCVSKQGIVQSNRKFFIDLMFSNENVSFMDFLERLEESSHQYIFKNKDSWFDGDIEYSDIENFFQSPSKMYKSGKYYLVRTAIPSVLGNPQLTIYDEKENTIEFNSLTNEDSIMSILEVTGIKCSARTFQVVLEVKQMMKMQKQNVFSKCLFSNRTNTEINEDDSSLHNITKNIDVNKEDTSTHLNLVKDDLLLIKNGNVEPEPIDVDESSTIDVESEPIDVVESNTIDVEPEPISIEPEPMDVDESNTIDINDNSEYIDESDDKDKQLFSENIQELELNVEDLEIQEPFSINERKDVYYKMYKDARKKAKIAKELALASYLEARNIKNTYMLEDIENSDSEDEMESVGPVN